MSCAQTTFAFLLGFFAILDPPAIAFRPLYLLYRRLRRYVPRRAISHVPA